MSPHALRTGDKALRYARFSVSLPQSCFFYKLEFLWLHFICQILQIMDAQAALSWKCFNELPKSVQGGTTEELKTFQEMLQDINLKEISPWQASRIYAAMTLQKALVQPKDLLHLVRTSFATIFYGRKWIFLRPRRCAKICIKRSKRSPQGHASRKMTLARRLSMCCRKNKLSSRRRWKALMDEEETLQPSSKLAMILKKIPVFDAILRVLTNNAPHTPHGDTKKAAWDRQVRDVMRVLATVSERTRKRF